MKKSRNLHGKTEMLREDETNIIAFNIPASDDVILGRMANGSFVVNTGRYCEIFTAAQMKSKYGVTASKCCLERLGWSV